MRLSINDQINQLIKEKTEKNLPVSQWIIEKEIVNEIGKKLEFDNHKFLLEPMDDWSQLQVTMKAAQIGWSTLAILKSFWAAKMLDYSLIYTLMSERKLWSFQASKTDEIIAHNEIFKGWVSRSSALQKKVGSRFINYRGTFDEKDAITLTSDLNIHDEYDRSKIRIIDLYESRLGISDYKGRWYFSNPSVPKQGVHKYWIISDQKHWMLKCPACNMYQFLGWLDATEESNYAAITDLKDKTFRCRKCGKVLLEELRKEGKWVAKNPGKDWSGYWVSQLIAPWISYKEIFRSFENSEITNFMNFVLGLPTKGESFQANKELILSKCDPSIENDRYGAVMGVDVGKILHYVIGNEKGIFKVGTAEDWEQVELLMQQFQIGCVIIDSEPDITAPRKLQEKYRGRIILANYHRGRKSKQWFEWGMKKNVGQLSMYRSKAIGYMIDWLKNKAQFTMFPEELYNKDYEKNKDYVSQIESFFQIKELDKQTGEVFLKWDSGDEDHFGHATIYFLMALMRGQGKVIVSSEVVDNKQEDYFERAKEGGFEDSWLNQ